jgi:hypothetical protein
VRELLSIGTGGWVQYLSDRLPGIVPTRTGLAGYGEDRLGVLLRVRDQGGRLQITELYMATGQALSARILREVPLGRLEAWVNRGDVREAIEADMNLPGPDFGGTAEQFHYGRPVVEPRRTKAPRLNVPARRPYPDEFFRKLADLYARLAREGERPAKTIADANGIPMGTVYGWIREARRRGLLPPARQGTRG